MGALGESHDVKSRHAAASQQIKSTTKCKLSIFHSLRDMVVNEHSRHFSGPETGVGGVSCSLGSAK